MYLLLMLLVISSPINNRTSEAAVVNIFATAFTKVVPKFVGSGMYPKSPPNRAAIYTSLSDISLLYCPKPYTLMGYLKFNDCLSYLKFS